MWLRAELFLVEDGEPVASVTVGHVDPERLEAAVRPIAEGFAVQLRRRALELRLARLMPALAADLFPHAEIPARKVEAWVSWAEAGRDSVLVVLRGDYAGSWQDMATRAQGGPLDLVQRALVDPGQAADAMAWADRWLGEREPAQASLGEAAGDAAA